MVPRTMKRKISYSKMPKSLLPVFPRKSFGWNTRLVKTSLMIAIRIKKKLNTRLAKTRLMIVIRIFSIVSCCRCNIKH
jgi:hypothetical protein